jgi:hypothetical protein
MTCEAFLGHLFLARDVTHSVHLNTRSYAKHKALNKFMWALLSWQTILQKPTKAELV